MPEDLALITSDECPRLSKQISLLLHRNRPPDLAGCGKCAKESASMVGIVLAVLGVGMTPGQAPPAEPIGSYVYQPSYELDFLLRGPPVPYQPQAGDIVFSTDRSRFWK